MKGIRKRPFTRSLRTMSDRNGFGRIRLGRIGATQSNSCRAEVDPLHLISVALVTGTVPLAGDAVAQPRLTSIPAVPARRLAAMRACEGGQISSIPT